MVGGRTTEGVSHPRVIPVDGEVVLTGTVLHVMGRLPMRLHKSDSGKTMRPAKRPGVVTQGSILIISHVRCKAVVEPEILFL